MNTIQYYKLYRRCESLFYFKYLYRLNVTDYTSNIKHFYYLNDI